MMRIRNKILVMFLVIAGIMLPTVSVFADETDKGAEKEKPAARIWETIVLHEPDESKDDSEDESGNESGSDSKDDVITESESLREISDGRYMLTIYNKGTALAVQNSSGEEHAALMLEGYTYKLSQQFDITKVDDNWYKIVNVYSQQALSVKERSKITRTAVEQRTYTGADSQLWRFVECGDGCCYIQSKLGTALNCISPEMKAGSFTEVSELSGICIQRWKIEPAVNPNVLSIKDGVYQISGYLNGDAVIIPDDYSANTGSAFEVNQAYGHMAGRFEITEREDGWYSIVNSYSGLALDLLGGAGADGTNVCQTHWEQTDSQLWRFVDAGNGAVYIQSKAGLFISREADQANPGTFVFMQTMNLSAAQMWLLEEPEEAKLLAVHDQANYFFVSALDSNSVLEIADKAQNGGEGLTLHRESLSLSQKIKTIYTQEGWYKLEMAHSGLVLDAAGCVNDENEMSQQVQQMQWTGADTQLWRFLDTGDGYCMVQSKSGLVLTLMSDMPLDGTGVSAAMPENTSVQKFRLCNTSAPDYVHITTLTPYTCRVTLYSPSITDADMLFAVWSEDGGQDDLMWIDGMKQEDDSQAVLIDTKKFDSKGIYQIHIYADTEEGRQIVGMAETYLDKKPKEFVWPCPSSHRITSYFGYRTSPTAGASSYHKGIDIGASHGSNIVSVLDGVVETVGYNSYNGNYVIVNHGDGVRSLYLHMSRYAVYSGQSVSAGQVIGYVGSTGISTGPHLHFSITINGSYVNPLPYLQGTQTLQ